MCGSLPSCKAASLKSLSLVKMPMIEVQTGDQTARYDREATTAVYGSLEHGGAEKCGCMFCKNFDVQRDLVYPA
jgi:hypothetical protein